MFTGNVDHIECVELHEGDDISDFETQVNSLTEHFVNYDEILVFVDLLGGSPCTVAIKLFAENPKVKLISGMNVPVVLTATLEHEEVSAIVAQGKDSIIDVKEKLTAYEDDDD